MTEGLGLRYALIGPFETMQLNANGMLFNKFRFTSLTLAAPKANGISPNKNQYIVKRNVDENKVIHHQRYIT